MQHAENPPHIQAHLVFADTRANAQKTKRAIFFQRSDRRTERISNIFCIEKRDIEKQKLNLRLDIFNNNE